MFRRIEDFLAAYDYLTTGTNRVFAVLSDENLGQAVAPGYRTLGQLGWHIVASVPEMMNRTGLGLSSVDEHALPPDRAERIRDAYRSVTDELVEAVRTGWTDETLEETDELYGERWPRGVTLNALISHEIHHRGQMTVLLRQAGAEVPGVFGPAKQEWAAMGMEPPPY